MTRALVADRECGGCTVCCSALTVDEPDLQKLPGHDCPNSVAGQGCGIYETRPAICRRWFCGWRLLDWVDPRLRPDRTDVLVCLMLDAPPEGYDRTVGLDIALLSEAGLRAEGLAETIRDAIRANIAVTLCVPGAPGMRGGRMFLNDDLRDSATSGSAADISGELKSLYIYLLLSAREVMSQPIILTRGDG